MVRKYVRQRQFPAYSKEMVEAIGFWGFPKMETSLIIDCDMMCFNTCNEKKDPVKRFS